MGGRPPKAIVVARTVPRGPLRSDAVPCRMTPSGVMQAAAWPWAEVAVQSVQERPARAALAVTVEAGAAQDGAFGVEAADGNGGVEFQHGEQDGGGARRAVDEEGGGQVGGGDAEVTAPGLDGDGDGDGRLVPRGDEIGDGDVARGH